MFIADFWLSTSETDSDSDMGGGGERTLSRNSEERDATRDAWCAVQANVK
jgi:hypothetical protein